MSDYRKIKCVCLPIPNYLQEKFDSDIWEIEKYILETTGINLDCYNNPPYFNIAITTEDYYFDYILFSSYAEDSGDYGFSFYLNDEEKEKYKKEFDKLGIEYNVDDLRKVVYCWYDGVEPPNYYEVSEDIFEKL